VQGTANFGMPTGHDKYAPYEDLVGFMKYADELALSLLSEGYTGMKIWPFDEYAEASNGTYISNADLKKAMQPFEKIRKAVGDKIDIHVEFHSLWNLPTAIRIAKALEQFDPFWYEDPIKMDNLDAVAEYAHRTNVWVTASETLGTRWGFRDLFEKRAASVCMLDVGWCGGLSDELPQHAGTGGGARVLPRLVRQARDRVAAVEGRLHHRAARPGPGHTAAARCAQAQGCAHSAKRGLRKD
jgi:hypothetical protein